MNVKISSRYMGLLTTSLLLGFVATVYFLRGGVDPAPKQIASARLQNAPHFRVVTDPVELAQLTPGSGVIPGTISDVPAAALQGSEPAPTSAAVPANAETSGAGDTAAPASMGIAGGAALADADPAIQELKDLGMAMLMAPGSNWYTLQTAYVPAEDVNLLKRRILEASSALGSREGMFLYTAERNGRTYYGLCARRFETGAAAKSFKGKLDHKLGYPSQLRSKNGLQKEMGI